MESDTIQVETRIQCDGDYGTVLYVGEIEKMEGTWLGVEWDNPSRGKHSGCYNDVTYFKTRIPNAGSFVRQSKINFGRSCPEAVKEKYGNVRGIAKTPNFINLPQKTGRERHIEMVGMDKIIGKQSNFCGLTEVVLSKMLVNGVGPENELKELIPNARNLDLSLSLLTSWTDVAAITEQLVSLDSLILSKNRLKIPSEVETYRRCFTALKILVLNNMAYNWKEILFCASMWPHIEQLSVLENQMTYLEEPPSSVFYKLCFLNLDNNPIGNWKDICKLGKITNLEELHIDNVMLESISFPDIPPLQKTHLFPNLKSLYVRNNKLMQWQDISELNKLVKLKDLMVNNNPVINSVNQETARQFVVAKIVGLEKLNRSQIERSERRGAELDYIKLHHNEWLKSGGNLDFSISKPSEYFLAHHPTYLSLIQKHGVAEESEVKPQSSLLKNNLIPIQIYSPQMPDKPPMTKKLPAEMTVGKLKALVQRIFKIAAQNITLTCLNKENESQKMEMDNDLRQLSFYSLSEKDKIAVNW